MERRVRVCTHGILYSVIKVRRILKKKFLINIKLVRDVFTVRKFKICIKNIFFISFKFL